MNRNKKSKWEWYSVKLLFESALFGEPNTDKIDDNYHNDVKLYEECVVVVRAQSLDHAFKAAEANAKKYEMEYYNPYDQLVICKFVDFLDCFRLSEEEIKSGTEVYSRSMEMPVKEKTEEIIKAYFPEFSGQKARALKESRLFSER
ncbi:MAG: DUF4288 domain-containing protein [Bacillota bacterium]|nr:DUF4288 domain-containing protein [Bacillota bacterium]